MARLQALGGPWGAGDGQDGRPHRVQGRHGAVEEVVFPLRRRYRVPKPHVAVLLGPGGDTSNSPAAPDSWGCGGAQTWDGHPGGRAAPTPQCGVRLSSVRGMRPSCCTCQRTWRDPKRQPVTAGSGTGSTTGQAGSRKETRPFCSQAFLAVTFSKWFSLHSSPPPEPGLPDSTAGLPTLHPLQTRTAASPDPRRGQTPGGQVCLGLPQLPRALRGPYP